MNVDLTPIEPLYALLYRSQATHAMGDLEIRALTVRSGQRNMERGITGLFLYGSLAYVPQAPGAFVQWLEGPEDDVRALYRRITEDSRHMGEEVLAQGSLNTLAGQSGRLFPDWAMNGEVMSELPATLSGFLSYVRSRRQNGGETWAMKA